MTQVPYSGVPARYWHSLEDGRIQCDLCPRYCRLAEGQQGFCFVRSHRGGQMWLDAYGRSTGFAVDPIEKKPLNHFLPGSRILSFGTAGCNLGCRYCQNWHMSKSRETERLSETASPEEIAQAAKRLDCHSVAFTYNDPVIFLEYAVDTARACHELGLRTVAVTAAYICDEPRREFFDHMDAVNVDLKAFDDHFYRRLCSGRLDPVLDNLRYLVKETEVWTEITTLLIPDINDSDEELSALVSWILKELGTQVPLHFTAFHPDFRMTDHAATPLRTLHRARDIALDAGMQYVYTGNRVDPAGAGTRCPSCKTTLIERSGFRVLNDHLGEQNHCPNCGQSIPGVFA
ncbi:AmmeMemoRadiSam system radical SAM enzyme [bacterium]|nr:AmmeMemoRadiSam system radical SAM enzyme [bacterium]